MDESPAKEEEGTGQEETELMEESETALAENEGMVHCDPKRIIYKNVCNEDN